MRAIVVRAIVVRALVVIVLISAANGAHTEAGAAPCWRRPVEAPVGDPFRAPACPYCAGNRGIEFATAAGTPVRAVAAGRVTYVGSVAGTRYAVIQLASGWKVTYGNVASDLQNNDVVVAGSVIGRTEGALHFGLRDGDRYLDPTPFLGAPRYRARLVPTDGSRGNHPGPPSIRCSAVAP